MVKGRVVLSGDAASKIDLHKSLNWMLRRAPGIEPPAEVRSLGLTARNGWNHAWTTTEEGRVFIESLHNYFVVLDKDGRFQVNGVPAGDYDLALRLYEPPGDGCLVNPVGGRIIHFHVSEDAARGPASIWGTSPSMWRLVHASATWFRIELSRKSSSYENRQCLRSAIGQPIALTLLAATGLPARTASMASRRS